MNITINKKDNLLLFSKIAVGDVIRVNGSFVSIKTQEGLVDLQTGHFTRTKDLNHDNDYEILEAELVINES